MRNFSKGRVKVLGFILIAVLFVVGVIAIAMPILGDLKSNSEETKGAEKKNASLTTQLSGLTALQKDSAKIESINADLLKQFPELANIPSLLDNVGSAASNADISAEDITNLSFNIPTLKVPATESQAAKPSGTGTGGAATGTGTATPAPATSAAPADGDLASMEVTITVNGDPGKFQIFMANLSGIERAFTIKQFTITQSEENGSMTLTGTTFLYRHILAPAEKPVAATSTTAPSK